MISVIHIKSAIKKVIMCALEFVLGLFSYVEIFPTVLTMLGPFLSWMVSAVKMLMVLVSR